MKSPFTGKEMKVAKERREMTFRKETFPVVFHYYICEETGEKFEDEHFSVLNNNQVVNQYRVKHHIPFPEQIKEIRLKYDLSAAKMSEILGMGANSWRIYEGDEVPSKAHANLIQMIGKPENFEEYIQKYSELEEKERDKILKHVQKLKTDSCYCSDQLYRFNCQPDISTGFKAFDREKTKQVILYFAERQSPYKTKMNKLLFYSDFVHFRNTAQSITGLRYIAIPYGPVPNHFEYLFEALVEEGIICKEYTMTNIGELEQILPTGTVDFDQSLFTASELEAMEYIANTFKDTSASDIADISHREPAWKENMDEKRIISFSYAFGLETV
ncbi:MAG TPA: DNA-binding protein [Prolixibacteraceae bacterium]|nr:DNA-binding protein [Prolixibacteraceae bacterium]